MGTMHSLTAKSRAPTDEHPSFPTRASKFEANNGQRACACLLLAEPCVRPSCIASDRPERGACAAGCGGVPALRGGDGPRPTHYECHISVYYPHRNDESLKKERKNGGAERAKHWAQGISRAYIPCILVYAVPACVVRADIRFFTKASPTTPKHSARVNRAPGPK